MSRYFLLLLLNIPFILLSILAAITQYKLNRSTKKRLVTQVIVWSIVLFGLASAEAIYTWLFQHKLTETEPLSLFDVIQITAIIIIFYVANRSRIKIEFIEERLQSLHQEISIKLSDTKE